jgi:hypothetical protein
MAFCFAFSGEPLMSTNPPIIEQAYVFGANQNRNTPARFNGTYQDVREWLLREVAEPQYSTLQVLIGPTQNISMDVVNFLELTKKFPFLESLSSQRVKFAGPSNGGWRSYEVTSSVNDTRNSVNHPSHYNKGKFEVIDVIEDWKLGFCLGNAIKYIARAEHKGNNVEDLRKAEWYIQREIKRLEGEVDHE